MIVGDFVSQRKREFGSEEFDSFMSQVIPDLRFAVRMPWRGNAFSRTWCDLKLEFMLKLFHRADFAIGFAVNNLEAVGWKPRFYGLFSV
jgi:hypothetical protein